MIIFAGTSTQIRQDMRGLQGVAIDAFEDFLFSFSIAFSHFQ